MLRDYTLIGVIPLWLPSCTSELTDARLTETAVFVGGQTAGKEETLALNGFRLKTRSDDEYAASGGTDKMPPFATKLPQT